ncbi:MAG: UDP-N-acetylglucosamine 2-epimerase (hydrolyzing) [Deltaproteobacteria bacterium]|nr:UDP-N-acetylglucosamine 2-epimerase (hydrolyzing) [Deltaproteobacteria bacterium]
MKRIVFITGTRAEYDCVVPVLRELERQPGLRGEVLPCAAHLSPFLGYNVRQIEADGFHIVGRVESLLSSESLVGRSLSFAHLVQGLTYALAQDRPDVLFVTGDREEALAGALVGVFLQLPVAHLFGGDRCIASDPDELFRPAVSKLATVHLTASESHRARLIRMGEQPEYVFTTGTPALDRLRDDPMNDEALSSAVGIDTRRPFFLVIHHPSPQLDLEAGERELEQLLAGVLSFGHPVLCGYPNFDPGNVGMRRVIDEARTQHPNLRVHHNLERSVFGGLYRRATAIVGNSSSIVIEAPFLRVAGILVGHRQDLRETSSNVLRVEGDTEAVRDACRRALMDDDFRATVASCPSPYGDGHSAPRIAEILGTLDLDRRAMQKTMAY